MKLSVIALKNLKRNFSFYSLYLCSVSLVLTIFFCFTSFSMNEIIMEKISADGRVETMCQTVAVFLMAFVVFYMFYSNNFFMRRRMRELGIYALLGYRKSSMLELLTIENIVVCAGGLIIGIVAGGLLNKGITAGITTLLNLSIDYSGIPLINPAAVKSNLSFIAVVLLALALSNARILWKCTLLDLVRLEKKREKPIHPHASAAILGAILLIFGYGLAMDIRRGKASVWNTIGFSPIALLTMASVVVGTVLFIYSFLPFVCQRVRRQKQMLYQENTIIVVPKFMKHIRSSAKSLILLILLSAGTIAVFGATVLSIWYPYQTFQRIIPSAAEYRVENEEQRNLSLRALSAALGENTYQYYETTIVKTTASSENLPLEYNVSEDKGRIPGFECISLQDYRSLLAQQEKDTVLPELSDGECILIKYHPDYERQDLSAVYHLAIGNSETADVTVVQTSLTNPIGFANSVGTLVVSDALYQRLLKSSAEKIKVISINGAEMRSNPAIYGILKEVMPDNIYLVSAWQRETDFVSASSSTFLLIGFATIIFLIATGSILYFQNISTVSYALERLKREELLKKEFANYLHDDILQDLLSIKNLLRKSDQPDMKELLYDTLNQLNASIRSQMEEYHPMMIGSLPFIDALQSLLDTLTQHSTVSAILDCDKSVFLVDPYNTLIYRIIHELTVNALKHSNATKIWVLLTLEHDVITLKVSDNGIGFDMSACKQAKHRGLASIQEQVSFLEGSMSIETVTGVGTKILITMPMRGESSYESLVN